MAEDGHRNSNPQRVACLGSRDRVAPSQVEGLGLRGLGFRVRSTRARVYSKVPTVLHDRFRHAHHGGDVPCSHRYHPGGSSPANEGF